MASKSNSKRGGIVRIETWSVDRKAGTSRVKVAVRVPAGGDRSGNRPGTFYGATNFRQSL